MKRFCSIIVALFMLFGIIVPPRAYAEQGGKIELKQAIEIAKNAFSLVTDNYDFNYNYSENMNGRNAYQLNWNGKKAPQSGIYVSVDASSGEILSMNRWVNTIESRSRIPAYTREQALNAASAMAAKLQPERFAKGMKLKEQPRYNPYNYDMYSTSYDFYFIRVVNGIEFQDNGINISVDKNSLMVMNYNYQWDNVDLPDASKAIDTVSAKKIFADKLGLELSYQLFVKPMSKDANSSLVYSLKNGNTPIDALTGELVDNGYYGPMFNKTAESKYIGGMGNVLTPGEQNTVDDANKYISKDKAMEVAKKYLPLNDSYNLTYCNLYTGYLKNTASWSMSWEYNDPDKQIYGYLNAQVDAVTGQIQSFSIGGSDYDVNNEYSPSFNQEDCKTIAEKFLKETLPDKYASLEYRPVDYGYDMPSTGNVPGYNFNYIRKHNGVTCISDSTSIYVNAYTGKVLRFYTNWTDITFPPVDGAMSLESAYNNLYSKADFTLKYIRYYDYRHNSAAQVRLAYVLDNYTGIMDAKTGAILDYNGNPIKERTKNAFTDIKGNPNENNIKLLNELGLLDESSNQFMPQNKILQKDFVKMLVYATAPYYEIDPVSYTNVYDRCYELAIQRKIITEQEKKPESTVTRQDAAKMIVKALGVGFVADLSNIYTVPFKDAKSIAAPYKGYVVIASELKVMLPVNGNFNPTVEVTRGDAATMIVNYLKVNINPVQ